MVVNPYVKLSIDFFVALLHPRKHYRLKKSMVDIFCFFWFYLASWNPYWGLAAAITAEIFMQGLSMAFRRTKSHFNHKKFTRYKSNEPFVPLDVSGDPRSALLLTRHVLIGGDSGSGKSNAVWTILEGLNRYAIPFRAWVIDPAGGVELNDLQDSAFTVEYVDRPADADPIITKFRDAMNDRLARMKAAGIRQFNPNVPLEGDDNNWHYLFIDELLLCAAQIKAGPLSPLGDVLAVGRKAGFIAIACTQLGQKTTLGDFRDLFPQRVCFGTRTMEMTDAILGTSAHQEAPAERIRHVGQGFLWTMKANGYFMFQTKHIKDTKAIAFPVKKVFPAAKKAKIVKQAS